MLKQRFFGKSSEFVLTTAKKNDLVWIAWDRVVTSGGTVIGGRPSSQMADQPWIWGFGFGVLGFGFGVWGLGFGV